MALSPSQKQLVAVHFNGSISLWDFPSLRLRNIWKLEDQPCHDDVNPSLSSRFGRKRRRNSSELVTLARMLKNKTKPSHIFLLFRSFQDRLICGYVIDFI